MIEATIVAILDERLLGQVEQLAVHVAIGQLCRVDMRILALFGHLAGRWGRLTPEGVGPPLKLTRTATGRLVGAQRTDCDDRTGRARGRARADGGDGDARALDEHPDAKAVAIFTPSYYGTAADVRAIAEACHARDVPLVTDDAWGLDYALSGHPDLPDGALSQGSDLAIVELEKSTSASTILMSSIDGARPQFVRDGHELLDRALTTARHLRERLADEVPELTVVSIEEPASRPGVVGVDPTHPLIETWPVGLTGFEADDWIRDQREVDIELVDHRRIMPLVTFAHGVEDADRLVDALRDLVDEKGKPGEERTDGPPGASGAAHRAGADAAGGVLRQDGARQAEGGCGPGQRRARDALPARDPGRRARRGLHGGDRRLHRAGRRRRRLPRGRRRPRPRRAARRRVTSGTPAIG